MKKIAFFVFTLISLTAFSQEGRPPRGEKPHGEPNDERPKREKISVDDQVKKISSDLNLTEIQQLQVREILVEQEQKREAFNSQKDQAERPSREEMEAKMTDERKASDEKFKKILTPEQFTKWSENKPNGEKEKPKKEPKNKKKTKKKSKKENIEN